MRAAQIIALCLELARQVLELLRARKKEHEKKDYEQDIRDIQNDPVDYARREYGGVPDNARNAASADLHSDTPDGPKD